MPANRHRRRAAAARARRRSPDSGRVLTAAGRIAITAAGLLLIALALFLLLAPRTTRNERGSMFALVIGVALVVSAWLPGRR